MKDLLKETFNETGRFYEFATEAVEIAWYAGTDRGIPPESDLHDAAEFFAFAIAELWMAFLQALIIAVMKRAGKVAEKIAGTAAEKLELKAHVGEVAQKLAESKLGKKFGDWFERDFEKINESVEKWKQERRRGRPRRAAGQPQNRIAINKVLHNRRRRSQRRHRSPRRKRNLYESNISGGLRERSRELEDSSKKE